jgi:Fe-S cluster biogenesis protein NfuA
VTRDLEDVQRRLQKVESLVAAVQRSADPSVRAAAQELVESILDMHGAGIERMLAAIAAAGEPGVALLDQLRRDDLVASLLLLHGLHPVDLTARVGQAIEGLGPALASQGGSVELVGIDGGVARVRLTRSGHGCAGSAALQQTVRAAFYEAAPDLQGLEIDERSDPLPVAVVPLSALRRGAASSPKDAGRPGAVPG